MVNRGVNPLVVENTKVPDLLRDGEIWARPQERRFVLLKIDGKPYRAALKIDASRTEVWFLSLIYKADSWPSFARWFIPTPVGNTLQRA